MLLCLQGELDLKYEDGGDELLNLIAEISEMRYPCIFLSVVNFHVS